MKLVNILYCTEARTIRSVLLLHLEYHSLYFPTIIDVLVVVVSRCGFQSGRSACACKPKLYYPSITTITYLNFSIRHIEPYSH
jgi:hypothetical protein